MTFLGLALSQVLAVLGVVAAVVVILYLLKPRLRQVPVPFVSLWVELLTERRASQLARRWRVLLSLLLALTLVALLAFSLGDPLWQGTQTGGRVQVVMVDVSASMQATDVKPDRLGRAKQHVRELVRTLATDESALIATVGTSVTPLTPITSELPALLRAVDHIEAEDGPADWAAARGFVSNVLYDPEQQRARPARVVWVTDRSAEAAARSAPPTTYEEHFVRLGSADRNIGITALSVRRHPLDPRRSEALVEIWNASPKTARVELRLLGDGQPVEVAELSLAADERKRRIVSDLSGVSERLEAEISLAEGARDALRVDDRAYARLPARRRTRVLAVSNDNLYLAAALLLDEYLEVTTIGHEQYQTDAGYDVAVFDGLVPAGEAKAHRIYLGLVSEARGMVGGSGSAGARPQASPVALGRDIPAPFFENVRRKHPVMRWLALGDVNIARGTALKPQGKDVVLGSDRKGALLVAGQRKSKRFVAMGFDVRDSDLPLRVAWPLLLLNAIDWFTQADEDLRSSFVVGDRWRLPVPGDASQLKLLDPQGVTHSLGIAQGRAVFRGVRAGWHTLSWLDADGAVASESFAANPPTEREARIAVPEHAPGVGEAKQAEDRVQQKAVNGQGERAEAISPSRRMWLYLVGLALLLLLAEWWLYHRRVTV